MSASRKVRGELDLVVETIIYLQTEGRRLARQECAKVGVSPTQLNVIKLIDQLGQLSLSELALRLATQNATVTGIIDRMDEGGLVTRQQSPDDRRVWHVRLTERGQKIASTVESGPWEVLRRAVDALDRKKQQQLVALLREVATFVGAEIEEKANGTKR
jgi:DNA-binding MarR family transcriptional regulator